jgi:hypothetical protein
MVKKSGSGNSEIQRLFMVVFSQERDALSIKECRKSVTDSLPQGSPKKNVTLWTLIHPGALCCSALAYALYACFLRLAPCAAGASIISVRQRIDEQGYIAE